MVGDKPQRCNSLCGFSSAILTSDVGSWIPAFAGMTSLGAGVNDLPRGSHKLGQSTPATEIQRKELPEGVVLGDAGRPAVGCCDGGIEGGVGVGEPLGAGVVEVGEGTFLELFGGGRVVWDGALGIAGDGLVDPGYPFGRV